MLWDTHLKSSLSHLSGLLNGQFYIELLLPPLPLSLSPLKDEVADDDKDGGDAECGSLSSVSFPLRRPSSSSFFPTPPRRSRR